MVGLEKTSNYKKHNILILLKLISYKMDKNKLISDYQVRKATLGALGGDTTKDYKSVYEVDLAILEATEQGAGGGAKIDDETISAQTVWSSQKTKEEIDNAGGLSDPFYTTAIQTFDQLGITEQTEDNYADIALAIYKNQSGPKPSLQLFQNDNSAIIDIESLAFNTTDTDTAYRADGIYYGSDATGELFVPITDLAKIGSINTVLEAIIGA